MKQDKFLVKIPLVEDKSKYEEVRFKTQSELCTFLEITPNTMYSIIHNRLQFVHLKKQKLKGIIIEKIPLSIKKKVNTTDDIKNNEEYQLQLLSKAKQLHEQK